MTKISLRKIKTSDKKYFARWWRDEELLTLTSGVLRPISDKEVEKYFSAMILIKRDCHYVVLAEKKVIGHVSLAKRPKGWYETQIVIGEKEYWNKGCGPQAIKILLKKEKSLGGKAIYLEVRPTNKRAIKAYEQCGFRKVKLIKHPKNKYLPKTLRMELMQG
ncbi:MAG: GNAT family N-acetyltransferase, partial [Patescibacteria group bacterium]